jgi:adenylate kinase family enzyme
MAQLILINGAPGAGKSTLAALLAEAIPMTLALDIDALKHALGRWEDDSMTSGLQARRLGVAVAREQLAAGMMW